MQPSALPSRGLVIAALTAVYLIWGSTYLVMQIAIEEVPPLLMSGARFVSAGLVLATIGLARGGPRPTLRDVVKIAPIGVLLFAGGNGMIVIAQQSVVSGATALVAGMMPLWMGVLGFVSGERPTRREWMSLVIGFVGILVLKWGPSLDGEPFHIVLLLLAPLSWALGSLFARRLDSPVAKHSLMMPAVQMMTGGAVMLALSPLHGESIPDQVSGQTWLAVVYLWMFGSLVAFTAYNWLLRNTRPVVATSYAYVNPSIAVLLGGLLHAEPLGPTTLLANALLVVAIWLALARVRVRPAAR